MTAEISDMNENWTLEGSMVNMTQNETLHGITDLFLREIEFLVLMTLFFLTIAGNLSVIMTLLFYRNYKSKRRSTCFGLIFNRLSRMSFYIVNLSVADICVAFMSILPQIIWRKMIFFNQYEFLCKFVTFSQVFSVYVSTFVLIVMAYDRYMCICWPIKSCNWTYKKASIGIVLAWSTAAIVSAPQLFLFSIQEAMVNGKPVKTCFVKWSNKVEEGAYIITHMLLQFVIPLLVLTFFYTRIFLAVSRNIHFKSESISMERGDTINNYSFDMLARQGSHTRMLKSDSSSLSLRAANAQKSSKFKLNCLRSRFTKLNSSTTGYNFKHKFLFSSPKKQQQQHMTDRQKSYTSDDRKSFEMRPMIDHSTSWHSPKYDRHKSCSSGRSFNIKDTPIRHNCSTKVLTKSKMKTLKLTLSVVIAYVLCTLPFYVSVITNFFYYVSPNGTQKGRFFQFLCDLTIVANLLYQLNSCANPFIYMFFNGNLCKIIEKRKNDGKGSIQDGTQQTELTESMHVKRTVSMRSLSAHRLSNDLRKKSDPKV